MNINNLSVTVDNNSIIANCSLSLNQGSFHVLTGPNGSGKSTLAYAVMGHPLYTIVHGSIIFSGNDFTHVSPDVRARAGIFLAAQHSIALPGVRVFDFLQEMKRAQGKTTEVDELYDTLCAYMDLLNIDHSFAYRNVHDGFSGGEKKRFELLQLLMFKPKIAFLDELDTGLDVEGLYLFSEALKLAREENPALTVVMISHNMHLMNTVPVDVVHIMMKGRIVHTGDTLIINHIKNSGYALYEQ